jgi:hypothetical protein
LHIRPPSLAWGHLLQSMLLPTRRECCVTQPLRNQSSRGKHMANPVLAAATATQKSRNVDNLDCPYSPYSHTGSSLHLASHAHTHAKSQNNIPRGYSGTYCFALPWHARLRRRLLNILTSDNCSFARTNCSGLLRIKISSENLGMIG